MISMGLKVVVHSKPLVVHYRFFNYHASYLIEKFAKNKYTCTVFNASTPSHKKKKIPSISLEMSTQCNIQICFLPLRHFPKKSLFCALAELSNLQV